MERFSLKDIDSGLLKLVPKGIAVRYCAIPVRRRGEFLQVAMVDPENVLQLEDLAGHTGFSIEPLRLTPKEITQALKLHYQLSDDEYAALLQRCPSEMKPSKALVEYVAADDLQPDFDYKGFVVRDQDRYNLDAPAAGGDESTHMLLNGTLERALELGAEAIFIVRTGREIMIRFRIDGNIISDMKLPPAAAEQFCSKLQELGQFPKKETNQCLRGLIVHSTSDRKVRFPAWWFKSSGGERFILKVCDAMRLSRSITDLGLQRDDIQFLLRAARRARGLIVFSGPPRQGSTTTMMSLINTLNLQDKMITLLSDSLEYQLPEVNFIDPQLIGQSYLATVENAIKSGTDIICIDDIHRLDRAPAAIAASHSQITLATMKATDGINTLLQLPLLNERYYEIQEAEISIICQRLIRKLCNNCKRPAEDQKVALERLNIKVNSQEPVEIYDNEGCELCNGTGFSGRVGIYQTLFLSEELKDGIARKINTRELRTLAKNQGMAPLRDIGLQLVFNGITTLKEIFWTTYKAEE